ncbi:hypothetical protein WCLP8_1080001 [uncultured Gammaproteobacteria bacterium]
MKGAPTLTVVWKDGEGSLRATLVEQQRWSSFVAQMTVERAAFRTRLAADGRKGLEVALEPVFAEMRSRVQDYANWYFSFFTSYRFFGTVAISTVGKTAGNWFRNFGEEASKSVAAFYGDQFTRVVIRPELFERAVIVSVVRVLSQAQERQKLFDLDRERRMIAFVSANGRPMDAPVSGTPLVIGRESLGWAHELPSFQSMDPVATVGVDDVLGQLKTHGDTDTLVMFARQTLRQGVRALVRGALVTGAGALVTGGDLVLSEGLASWVVAGLSFGVGMRSEGGLIQILEFFNRDQFVAEARELVEALRTRQLAMISAGIERRIDLLFAN